jgi:ectoine hydroxylase-related dioxygenase (phytanoyl-CoA dioxygenase family)
VNTLTDAGRVSVAVEQYRQFRRDGYLIVDDLLSQEDVSRLKHHADDIVQGRMPWQSRSMPVRNTAADDGTSCQPLARAPDGISQEEREQYFLRIHMLHRTDALHERMLLHPRILDVIQGLTGPDVLALSTMFFFKPPGKPGQGWHQDSFYLPVYPDSLCGVWIAVDDCDESNGALEIAAGSCIEPVYPPASGYGFGDDLLSHITRIHGASDAGADNQLAVIAARYPVRTIAMKSGSGVFFSGHVLHRSTANNSKDRQRRSFAAHYCNARSLVRWGSDQGPNDVHAAPVVDQATGMANASYILARGKTHLPFALPAFGTPCAAMDEVAGVPHLHPNRAVAQ